MSLALLDLNESKKWLNARVNSLIVDTPISSPVIGFRYSLLGGSSASVPDGFATATFLENYGPASADPINFESPDFNRTTGIYTIPKSGLWHLTAGIFFGNFSGGGAVDTNFYCAIAPPGNSSDAYIFSTAFVSVLIATNWSIQCTDTIYLTEGTELQVFTQQKSGVAQTLAASNYNFFSGYLVSDRSSSSS